MHWHWSMGWRHVGHMRPLSVEETSPPLALRDFMAQLSRALCHNLEALPGLLFSPRKSAMSRQSVWATKVAALVQGGQAQAALAQIKVAPTVRDVEQLRTLLASAKLLAKHPNVDAATADQIVALSSPRLHRSP